MRKTFLLLLAIGLSPALAWGYYLPLNGDDGADGPIAVSSMPIRTVDESLNTITVTYTFSNAWIQNDPLYHGPIMWNVEGFGYNETPGEPRTPFRIDTFTLPGNANATVTLVESEYTDFNMELCPARPPLSDDNYEGYTTENVITISDYDGFYPSKPFASLGTSTYRDVSLLEVQTNPIQYNHSSKTIRAYTKIKYQIRYLNKMTSALSTLTTEAEPVSRISADDSFLSNISIAGNKAVATVATSTNNATGYLIITVPSFHSSALNLANWKRQLGYDAQIIERNDWTPEIIKQEVRNYYREHPNLYYLLILGDHKLIPAEMKKYSSSRSYPTDYYYGCMDDNDKIADIYRGRIPAPNSSLAASMVRKAIDYEQNPTTSPDFYKTGLHCAFFQDSNEDCVADRRFAQTSEDIRDYVMGHNKNVKRVYYAYPNVDPQQWSKEFSTGGTIPAELKKPGFAWNGSTSDITSAINDGAFYVLHRDHGEVKYWDAPRFTNEDVKKLGNTNKLPIVFSINCLTGKFDEPDYFAYSWLSANKSGAAAVIAASCISYSGPNDILACGMFDAIWPNPGFFPDFGQKAQGSASATPVPTYCLGQILDQGLKKVSELGKSSIQYTRELFHCFGDPSMRIYTDTPAPFSGVEVTRTETEVSVTMASDYARITFFDEVADSCMYTVLGRRATYRAAHPHNITVCISEHNRIPYIDKAPQLLNIQNTTIDGPAEIIGRKINIGSSVTDTEAAGPVFLRNGPIIIHGRTINVNPNTTIFIDSDLQIDLQNNL